MLRQAGINSTKISVLDTRYDMTKARKDGIHAFPCWLSAFVPYGVSEISVSAWYVSDTSTTLRGVPKITLGNAQKTKV